MSPLVDPKHEWRALSGVTLSYEWISMDPSPRTRPPRRSAISLCSGMVPCALWAASSNGLIVLNKHIMSTDGFRHPMALSSLGMIASWVLSSLVCRLGIVRVRHRVSPRFFATRFLPVGCAMAIMFYTGNGAYLYLSVAFVQMLKTATPVVTMAVMVAFKLETLSVRLVLALLLLTAGTALASLGEIHFSWVGVGMMLVSEVADALRLVLTQLLLSSSGWHPIEALRHLAPACAGCLVAGAYALEWEAMRRDGALGKMAARPALYALAAVLGFVVNAAQVAAIKQLSSLTLKVVGVTANSLLVCGCVLLGEVLTRLQLLGYAISFGGTVWYNAIRHRIA